MLETKLTNATKIKDQIHSLPSLPQTHTHTHTHIYIYIYIWKGIDIFLINKD